MTVVTTDLFKPLQALKQSMASSHGILLPHINAATDLTVLTTGVLMNMYVNMYVGHVSMGPTIS